MNKILLLVLASISLYACTEGVKSDTSAKSPDAKGLYEKNLGSLKKGIEAIEHHNLDEWATTVADTTIWNAPAYGSVPGGKNEWKQYLKSYLNDWDSVTLMYPDFLPGID